jgi:hypothetical protein
MSFKSFAVFSICFATSLFLLNSIAFGVQALDQGLNANPGLNSNPAPNKSDGFAAVVPVMTFVDPNSGQSYGRYVTTETVPDVAYSYQVVKERVYVPTQVTENRSLAVVKYTPIQSYQLQLKNVPSGNPFASPQQVWQYVPIVQFQPNYESVPQSVTYVKYEEKEVDRKIPVLAASSKQVSRFVDRPLGSTPNGGNKIAVAPTNNMGIPNFNNQNVIQNAAQIAEANRNTSRYPTRPIDYPAYNNYPSSPSRNLVAQAPVPYYPNPAITPGTNPANPMLASTGTNSVQPPSNTSPATPLPPNMLPVSNTMASNNGTPAGAYSAASNPYYASTPYQANPYVTTAPQPIFYFPTFATGTGSLFGNSVFTDNRNTSYVASNPSVSQPYSGGTSSSNDPTFRPVTSPYMAPQQTWGGAPENSGRDPMQGGMPATVLR